MPQSSDDSARAMRSLCSQIEAAIARGDLQGDAVSELKGAIDETRTRVWASMEAAKSGDPSWVQEFWLHRAAEVCLTIAKHLERGDVDPRSAKARELQAVADRLARSLDQPG